MIPKVRFEPFIIPGGKNGSSALQGYQYDGLFMSQPHFRKSRGDWSGGGPFFTYRKWKTFNTFAINGRAASDNSVYTVYPYGVGTTPIVCPVPSTWESEQSTLRAHYATGYRRARPGNPATSLYVGFSEMRRDGLPGVPLLSPDLLLSRLQFFRALGSNYLNVVFGWIPFLKDLRGFIETTRDLSKKLDQIRKENGRGIHRKATIRDQSEAVETLTSSGNTPAVPGMIPWATGSYRRTLTVTTTEKVWFSSCWRYYIQDLESPLWTARAISVLYGALPTPSAIYEALPWSWLINWFTNLGDVLSNLSMNAVDNLTLKYSYVMRTYSVVSEDSTFVQWAPKHTGTYDWDGGSARLWCQSGFETKSRMGGGNPYGLEVTEAQLTPYRLGVVAALGLSLGSLK